MAIGSEQSALTKVLAEKMSSSCVDSHYTSKYWVRLHPNDAIKPQWAPDDNPVTRLLTRLLLFPIWLPFRFWERRKKQKEMTEFVAAGAGGKLVDDEIVRQLALEWVSLHPGDYILGEYDPRIPKLQTLFARILAENTLVPG